MSGSVPASLAPWLAGGPVACPCGREHRVPGCRVVLGPGALEALAEVVPSSSGPLIVVADPNTHDAAGARAVHRLRAAGRTVHEAVFDTPPRADERALAWLDERVRGSAPSALVAVGAGTISDLGKEIARRLGIPLVTVATAASMNGYLSPIAALTRRGLKVTSPAPPPAALLVDLDLLAAAPRRLTAAGFGDLASKPVSGADWVLAGWLFDEPVCQIALSVADDAVIRARAVAASIGLEDREALAVLAEALLLSGISMAIAGASAPASGGEHLVSHYLDMSESGWGRVPFLHGEQVAVATLASLALYRRLLAKPGEAADAFSAIEPPGPEFEALHSHLPPEAQEEIRREAEAKRVRRPSGAERSARLRAGWGDLAPRLDSQLVAGEGLAADLCRAGTPTRFSELGVSSSQAVHLLRAARHLRNRYTVLDLASDLGRLEGWAREIAEELA